MSKWIETLKKTGTLIAENTGFVLMSLAIIVALYFLAVLLEKILEKNNRCEFKKKNTKLNRMTIIAMFSALSFVLMLFEVPLWFIPSCYKLDASEIPVMIGAFALGPTAGVVIEGIKIILKVFIKGTSTAFVGDFANFVVGCMYVVPAAFIYHWKKTKKTAIIGMLVGTVFMSLAGCFLNAYLLIPTYAKLFYMPVEAVIGLGTAVNKHINSLFTFVALGVLPFNIIKGIMICILTTVLYKYVRKVI